MTNEKYRPTKLEDALARVAEECAEVIYLVCKAQRFGLGDHHPQSEEKNIDGILRELNDVQEAKADLLRILRGAQPTGDDPKVTITHVGVGGS